jgi:hypothetical protein
MTAFFTSAHRPWRFGLASVVLTLLSSIWFAMCFTAREQAWWNSISWFVAFYITAAILALRGIRSVLGVLALLLALVPLGLICILAVGR